VVSVATRILGPTVRPSKKGTKTCNRYPETVRRKAIELCQAGNTFAQVGKQRFHRCPLFDLPLNIGVSKKL
jgi:hypothetical protein